MRNFLFPSNVGELIDQGNRVLEQNKNSDRIKKILAVQAALRGVSAHDVAKCFNVSERTVQTWCSKVKKNGYSSLNRKQGSGRPHKLDDKQLYVISDWLDDFYPSDFDPEAENWSAELLSRVIFEEFHVSVSIKWCREHIKKQQHVRLLDTDKMMTTIKALTHERDMLLRENRALKEKIAKAKQE